MAPQAWDGLPGYDSGGGGMTGPAGPAGPRGERGPVGGYGPALVPLNTTGWTWINQGAASVVDANNISLLTIPAAAGTNLRAFLDSAPATPWTITAAVIIRALRSNNNAIGLVVRESGTGQLIILQIASIATSLSLGVAKYNSPTSFNATAASVNFTGAMMPTPLFLRIADNGTTLQFSYSFDGWNFIALYSEPRADFLPPNQVGVGGDVGGNDSSMSVLSWQVT